MAGCAVGRLLLGLSGARRPPPLRGDTPRRQWSRHLWHRVEPVHLAPAPEDDQVTASGLEVDHLTSILGARAVFTKSVRVPARLQQPRTPGAEREDGDHRVLAVPQIGVTVERDAVTTVAVERESDAVERHP